MFGHHDDNTQGDSGPVSDAPVKQAVDAEDKPSGQAAPQPSTTELSSASVSHSASVTPTLADEPTSADDQSWQHPGTPITSEQEQINDIISPAGGFPKRPSFPHSSAPSDDLDGGPNLPDDNADGAAHELIGIRQQALGDLAPIVDQLDLPPEEKFRTIMMMIQASDDQTMVKAAYAAAHSIDDEKTRAQALLDIINEVNYFTNPHEN